MCDLGQLRFLDFIRGQLPFDNARPEWLLWYEEQREQTRSAWREHRCICPECRLQKFDLGAYRLMADDRLSLSESHL
jgi:hypothetical protein